MDRYVWFMDQKTQYCKDVNSSQLIYGVNAIEIPRRLFGEFGNGQSDAKVCMEMQRAKNGQEQSSKIYTARYQQLLYTYITINRPLEQKNSETDLHSIYDKCDNGVLWGKGLSLITVAESTGYSQRKDKF